MDMGNNGVGVRSAVTHISTCISLKFRLEAKGQQRSYRSDRTHVKDVKDPV